MENMASSENARAFMGWANSIADAANRSTVQLWNPVGGTHVLLLDSVIVMNDATALIDFYITAAPLTNLTTNLNSKEISVAGAVPAEIREQRGAALVGISLFRLRMTAINFNVRMRPPLLIAQGFGVALQPTALNQSITGSFQWRAVQP